MTSGDLGNIGNFPGGVAVIEAPAYLALQLRQSTRTGTIENSRKCLHCDLAFS